MKISRALAALHLHTRTLKGLAIVFSLALIVIAVFCAPSQAKFKRGPVKLEALPEGVGEPVIWVGYKALERKELPKPMVEAAKKVLESGRDLIVVGHADPVGPKLLNNSLGFQFALETAHRIVRQLMVASSRVSCVTMGERAQKEESGVELYAGEVTPKEEKETLTAVSILNPALGGPSTHQLWALWDNDAQGVYWGLQDGEDTLTWKVETHTPPVKLPYPAKSRASAIGAQYHDGRWVEGGSWTPPEVDPRLMLTVENLESGWATVSGRASRVYSDIVVWSGGIPYPAALEGEKFVAKVVRYGAEQSTYAQASNAKGHAVVGPKMTLPRSLQDSPELLAVLTWEGDADLDLHAWRDNRETSPQDPDPDVSRTAAAGVKLLFDGDSRYRHSALWVTAADGLEIEVKLFSDLGQGADAVLYVIENPADPVRRIASIIGPRRLSDMPREQRWSAYGVAPIFKQKRERIRVRR